jgi:hypothetical protein
MIAKSMDTKDTIIQSHEFYPIRNFIAKIYSYILRNSRSNQHYVLSCITLLFYILAPTCFGSSMPSSESVLDPCEVLEIQIEWVVYDIMCCPSGTTTLRHTGHVTSHALYDTPPIRFVFLVTQKDLRNSLMIAGYCRNI